MLIQDYYRAYFLATVKSLDICLYHGDKKLITPDHADRWKEAMAEKIIYPVANGTWRDAK